LIPWRRAKDAHWTEQARKLYPARVSRAQTIWVLPAGLTFASRIFYPESLWGLVLAAGFFGTLLGNYPMDRATNPGLTFHSWRNEVAASWIMQLSSWGVYVLAAVLMPVDFGWGTLAVTALFFALFFAQQFGGAIRLMRILGLVRPASARLQTLVDATSTAMGVPVRATWEFTGSTANAFAFVTTRELGFGRRLVAVCTDNELKAICAHELGHLSESRWTLAGRLVGALILFPMIYARPAWTLEGGGGLAFLGLLVMAIWYGNFRLARVMENRADRVALESVEDAADYARGLERIHRASLVPAVIKQGAGQTHPNLYDRMLAAGVTPDYPRPAAPASHAWSGTVLTVLTTLTGMYLFT
jgi:Zn-dependent protease with chaperone function